jgi:DNA-binding MarR family transcriptional regulator
MLDRMERSDLIRRTYNKSDRRQVIITLTDKASGLRAEYNRVSDEMSEIFYQGFQDEEIERFESDLTRILHNLEEREEKR